MWMQVIALTEELLATAKQNDISGSDIGTSGRASPSLLQSKMVNPHAFHSFLSSKCALFPHDMKAEVMLEWETFKNVTSEFGFDVRYKNFLFKFELYSYI